MKVSLKFVACIIFMITALWLVPHKVSAQNENINLQVFYDELGDYGTWVDNPDYGYVWVPNVDPGFRPYVTDGHWVFTDYGWTWDSDYPWGWAAFHYGRWTWDEEYGHVWVPGTEWGPAWVVWRKASGYYGWAPMSPGMSTSYNQYNNIPTDSWSFVRDRDLSQYDLNNYFVDRMKYSALVRVSSLIVNTRYDSRYNHNYIFGPDRNEFQRYYGRIINPIHIYDNARPGKSSLNSDRFSIYRPQFNKRGSSSYNDSRPISFIKNREKINFTPNSYRNSRRNEPGRSDIQYNNNNANYNNSSVNANERERSNVQYNNNNNSNYNSRSSNANEPVRSNDRYNSNSNNTDRKPNANGAGKAINNILNLINKNSNANGTGRSNGQNTGTTNTNSRNANANGTGRSNGQNTGTTNTNSRNANSNGTGRSNGQNTGTTNTNSRNANSNANGTGNSNVQNTNTPNTNSRNANGTGTGTGRSNVPNTGTPNTNSRNSNANGTGNSNVQNTNTPQPNNTNNATNTRSGNAGSQQRPAGNAGNQQTPAGDAGKKQRPTGNQREQQNSNAVKKIPKVEEPQKAL